MTGSITQRIPPYIDGATPETRQFGSLDQLLAIDWIAAWREASFPDAGTFDQFSLAQDLEGIFLMAEFDRGASWFVVGQVHAGSQMLSALPRWVEPPDEDRMVEATEAEKRHRQFGERMADFRLCVVNDDGTTTPLSEVDRGKLERDRRPIDVIASGGGLPPDVASGGS